jgi:hypothetical protein
MEIIIPYEQLGLLYNHIREPFMTSCDNSIKDNRITMYNDVCTNSIHILTNDEKLYDKINKRLSDDKFENDRFTKRINGDREGLIAMTLEYMGKHKNDQ